MTADRVLARTTAVLSRIDDALDDPFPAAVARLAGVQGSWWTGCRHEEVVTIGSRYAALLWLFDGPEWPDCAFDTDHPEEGAGGGYPGGCWAHGGELDRSCLSTAVTDLGLCAHHHAEIVGSSHDRAYRRLLDRAR